MRELPYISIRLQNIVDVINVNLSIDEQWFKYVKSIVEPFLLNERDFDIVHNFLCTWATFCFNHFQYEQFQSNEYITKTTFPNFTINAGLIIERNQDLS